MKKKSANPIKLLTVFLAVTLLLSSIANAAKPVYSGGRERAAIRGFDPVSYFTEGQPRKGSEEFTLKHNGAKWMFSNKENLEKFSANPEKYTPQFGGYCAYAVANGSTASIKPEFFTIYNDKLYLNYSRSVYKKWLKDKDAYIKSASQEWPSLIDK